MKTAQGSSAQSSGPCTRPLSDEDIYMIVMLHQNQRMSSRDIARKFGISTARVRDIVARRAAGSCCG